MSTTFAVEPFGTYRSGINPVYAWGDEAIVLAESLGLDVLEAHCFGLTQTTTTRARRILAKHPGRRFALCVAAAVDQR